MKERVSAAPELRKALLLGVLPRSKVRLLVGVATKETDIGDAQADTKAEIAKAQEMGDDSKQLELFATTFQKEVDQAENQVESVKVNETKTSQKKPAKKGADEMQDAIKKLLEHGPPLQFNLFIETDAKEGGMLRAREPRIPEIEGGVGSHNSRSSITKQAINAATEKYKYSKRGLERISNYYENDHMPEKSLGKLVKAYVAGELASAKGAVATVKRWGKKSKPKTKPAKKVLLGDIDVIQVGENAGGLPAMTVYRPSHRQKTQGDAKDRDHGSVIENAKGGKTFDAKVSRLRDGIRKQLDKEVEETKKIYDADKGASPEVRGNVNAGIKQLYTENRHLYGISKKAKPPQVEEKATGDGSDLPITGKEELGIPDFLKMEGAKVPHTSRPTGYGKYLEYDHVIDGNLALKAKALKPSDPGLKDAIVTKAAARLPEGADKAAKKDLGSRVAEVLATPVFGKSPVASYDYGAAGTIALYRPIHRQITPDLNADAEKGILNKVNTGAATDALAEFAATGDAGKKEEGLSAIRTGVRSRFDEVLLNHIGAITREYDTEQGEVQQVNAATDSSQQMAMITARVKNSLKALNSASIGLLK